jgi:hypothetical protein
MLTSNSSNNTDNNTNIQSLYEIDYEQFLNKDIPAVVFLTVLSFIGIVGNVHTLLVYSMSPVMAKLTVRIFILWLSATDLIACVACIPFEIFDIRFSYTFSSGGACKFFRFLNHAMTLSSGGLLTAIAIERYKINNRIQTQQNRNPCVALNIASLVVVAISIVMSIPAFVFYGLNIKETGISGLTGTDCTVLSEYQHMRTTGVYTGIVILLSTACCVICAVVYGKILFVICVQMKKERKDKAKSNNYQMDVSSELTSKETQQVSTSQLNDVPSISSSLGKNVPSPVKTHKRSKYEKGRQLTISLIVATAVSYLGYILYASTILVKIVNPTLYKSSIRPVTGILLRGYFINNAANPVVFCLLDNTFRTECVKLYKKTICAKCLSKTC